MHRTKGRLKLELAAGKLDKIPDCIVCSTSSGIVLVVDDDPDIRDALCELLEDEGYRAVSASNGQEALAYLNSNEPPCVILLDLMMPVADGWWFRSEVAQRARFADVPIVVLSGARLTEEQVNTLHVDGYLKKPVDLAELLTMVGRFCQPTP